MVIDKSGFFSSKFSCEGCGLDFNNQNRAKEHEDRCPEVFDAGVFNLEDHLKERLEKEEKEWLEKVKQREEAKDYEAAIQIWERLGEIDEAARVRKTQAEMGSVKVSQKVVHGDEVTEIKDSVLNRSNVGSGGDDKFAKLERLAEMKEKGLIDDDEFKQMKKEILGK